MKDDIERIEKIEKSVKENIKIVKGRKAKPFEKEFAREEIEREIECLSRKYIYRQAYSDKDELARFIYKTMYALEQELNVYLDTRNGKKDSKVKRVYDKLTLYI